MAVASRTARIAEFASGLRYEDLPEPVVYAAKRCILDAVGCGIYGSVLPWSKTVLGTLRRLDGGGTATVWGTDHRMSAPSATLVNGTFVHSFELDDLHKEAIIHPGGVSIPAILAAIETEARDASGRDIVVAVVAAYEVSIRVGLATGLGLLHRGWHNNGVLGTFAAAAGVGRLLGLETAPMMDAIGMAGTQSAGLMAAQYGSAVKRMHAGRAAQSGLYAAELAADGFRGIRNIFEAGYGGFHNTFTEEYDLDELTKGLGAVWEILQVGFKPYPACGSNHTSIDAIAALRGEHEFTPAEVIAVTVEGSTATRDHVGWPYAPDTVTTAQMNLPYAVARALLDSSVSVASFSEEAISDPRAVAIASRVQVTASPEIDEKGRAHRHEVRLSLKLSDGRTLTRSVVHARGSSQFPLSDEDLDRKFTDLVGNVLPGRAAELSETIRNLEALDQALTLTEQLASSPRG